MSQVGRDIQALSRTFRTLGDQTRLRIVLLLQKGERNVTSICKELKIPQPTVSHHLGLLRAAELVQTRRDGKEIHYSLRAHRRVMSAGMLRRLLRGAKAVRIGRLLMALVKS